MTWYLIQPAPDSDGFVAHHLDRDLVARGRTPTEALEHCRDSVRVSRAEELILRDPEPDQAPDEFFDAAQKVVDLGRSSTLFHPHDVWMCDTRDGTVVGLNLKDHPGLSVPVRVSLT